MRTDRTTIAVLMPAVRRSSLVRLNVPVSLAGADVGARLNSVGLDARPLFIRCQERLNDAAALVSKGQLGGSESYR